MIESIDRYSIIASSDTFVDDASFVIVNINTLKPVAGFEPAQITMISLYHLSYTGLGWRCF